MAAIEKLRASSTNSAHPTASLRTEELSPRAAPPRPDDPSTHRYRSRRALASSYPFLADAGSRPGNCSGMEEATGAPSSLTDWGACGLPVATGAEPDDSAPVSSHNAPFSTYKEARLHHAARRRGGRVAARGARA